ncbi:MAG: hypothetical protein Nk1A_7970 [Endomicrobiia bacterium]|nr:MAG: hypothetical protein Nk1A_7970 [Endomicrobiia bacterium]
MVERLITDNITSVDELKEKIEGLFRSPYLVWEDHYKNFGGDNYIIEKPKITIFRDGSLRILTNYVKFSEKYSAKSNPKDFDLDTVKITKYSSYQEFEFEKDGITYEFQGNEDGTFMIPTPITTVVDMTKIKKALEEFKNDGDTFGEVDEFNLVYNFLSARYQDVNSFNQDSSQPDLNSFY